MADLTVVAKDRVGLLADISYSLGKAGLNIEFVSVVTTPEMAIVHLDVPKAKAAKKCLESAGFQVMEADHLFVRLKNQPGELANVARKLADAGINIKDTYILEAGNQSKLLAIDSSDNKKAKTILADRVITPKT